MLLHTQHVNETRTFEFLSAASRGDEVTVRKVRAIIGDEVTVRKVRAIRGDEGTVRKVRAIRGDEGTVRKVSAPLVPCKHLSGPYQPSDIN